MIRSAIVIGNGVVGLNVALALQRRGVQVTIVAPDETWRGPSWGNAGHIAIEQVEPLASLATLRSLRRRLFSHGGAVALPPRAVMDWLPFGLRMVAASRPERFQHGKAALSAMLATAIPAWRRVLDDAGAPGLLRVDGHFVVWETLDSARRGRVAWALADVGTATFRDADAGEMRCLHAVTTTRIAGAIRFQGTGQIRDTDALGRALIAGFLSAGGDIVRGRAIAVTERQGHAHVDLADSSHRTADHVVVAAGAASAPLIAPLGFKVPLISERGYHIEGHPGGWPADLPPVVFEDRSMIVTRFDGTLRAASIVEFAGFNTPPDPRKWQRLRDHVAALGLPFREPAAPWFGARPTLPDYLPAIGQRGAIAYAFGHQHLGLTLAATSGEALAAVLFGKTPGFSLAPFDLARFR